MINFILLSSSPDRPGLREYELRQHNIFLHEDHVAEQPRTLPVSLGG